MLKPTRDWMKFDNATLLAGRIIRYWREQGQAEPSVHLVKMDNPDKDGREAMFAVRSNMLDGRPR